jgi:predicted deacylase
MLDGIGKAGAKTYGAFEFAHPLLAGRSWPYISIRGAEDGPTLSVTGGSHGSEYAGIAAAMRFAEELDPRRIRGHVLVMPVVNQPAFWERVGEVCPVDGKNPSQVYPGRMDGTFTEVLAAYLFGEVFSHCDALVDLHGGDLMGRLTPFTIYQPADDPALTAKSRALAASYGFPVSVLRKRDVLKRPVPGYVHSAGALRGIPGITAECGGEDQAKPEDVAAHVEGLRRVCIHLGIASGTLPPNDPRLVEFALVLASRDGVFTRTADIQARVRAGDVMGALRDLWGRHVEDVVATVDGEVLFLNTSLAARKGRILFGLGAPVAAT